MRVREWCHPRDWRTYADVEFETNYFCEGMCAYRRQVFDAVGMYYEPLFVYCEGWDLGLRILNAGFRILYAPQIRVAHLMAGGSRLKASTFYLFTRNYCWIAYRNYPVFAGIGFLAPKLAMMLFFALRDGHLKSVAKGLRDGLHVYFQHGMPRIPISGDTVRYLRELERQRPNLLIRYARHRAATQL
jgi:GT2 family glycosyltransferase